MYELKRVKIKIKETEPLLSNTPVNTPKEAVKLIGKEMEDLDREVLMVVNLQSDLRPINVNLVAVGVLDSALVHPREVFKSAILSNAASIIMIHNHPSGKLMPSKDDLDMTERIKKAGEIIGIKLLDHVIAGKNGELCSILNS